MATTRAAAVVAQLHVYKGRPCLRGHDGLRYKVSHNCCHCSRARALAKWRREQKMLSTESDIEIPIKA